MKIDYNDYKAKTKINHQWEVDCQRRIEFINCQDEFYIYSIRITYSYENEIFQKIIYLFSSNKIYKKQINILLQDKFIKNYKNYFSFLIPQKKPLKNAISQEIITSCFWDSNIKLPKVFFNNINKPEDFVYKIYWLAFMSKKVIHFFGEHKISKSSKNSTLTEKGITCPVPHYGDHMYLDRSLTSLKRQLYNIETAIIYDGTHISSSRNIKVDHTLFTKNKKGPYIIRDKFLKSTKARYFLMQDSDDISCSDRIEYLYKGIKRNRNCIIGSHEIRIDEIEKKVYAVRYPILVSEALAKEPKHLILFGTCLMETKTYFSVGGFSTYLPYAMDTQFILRAYFSNPIINIDKFLYIRHFRKNSLSNENNIHNSEKIRRIESMKWKIDFVLVKNKVKLIDNTSLACQIASDYNETEIENNYKLSF